VRFTPQAGFAGTPIAVRYRVTDAYGQRTGGTYTPTVTPPQAPAPAPEQTVAPAGDVQERPIVVPDGGTLTLLDASGTPVDVLEVPGEGTYAVSSSRRAISFTPAAGYTGAARAIRYRVVDAYGQAAEATFQATVTGTPATPVVPEDRPAEQATAAATAPPVAAPAQPILVEPGCVSRRTMKIHFKAPQGRRLHRLRLAVSGAPVLALADGARAATVDLRGRGPELVTVRISARTDQGTRVEAVRRYRPCRTRLAGPELRTLRLER
jgi:CshA-type fibril repeat protein